MTRWMGFGVGVLFTAVALTGCSGGDDEPGAEPGRDPITITGPGDAATVQEAVDQAQTGDTVEVGPGTYPEAVLISTPGITLRGTDRNRVVFDGEQFRANGVTVTADDVVVENFTVRDYNLNGVLVTGMSDEDGGIARGSDNYKPLDPDEFPPLDGFAIRYVTSSNNGLYGLYAFDSHNGVIEQSYASGHQDSGIYVGQCQDCNIVVRDNVAERNAIGYEQANASDSVVVVGNRFAGNRVGLTTISATQEAFLPMSRGTVVGNLVADNNQRDTPAQADGGFGIGIGVGGAQDTLIARNRVVDNSTVGVVLNSQADWAPAGNRIAGNVARANGVDLWYAASSTYPGQGNCLEDNRFASFRPASLADDWSCPAGGDEAAGVALVQPTAPEGISYRDVVAPPEQPQMPASELGVGPGAPDVDVDAIGVPPADLFADRSGL